MKRPVHSQFRYLAPFLFLLTLAFPLIQSCGSNSNPTNPNPPAATNTPTDSPTPAVTSTATNSPTPTTSSTPTNSPTKTPTPTTSSTATNSPTPTPSSTATHSPTATPTSTPSNSPTLTPTSTPTDTPTITSTPTNSPTATASDTPTDSPTATPSDTPTDSPTITFTPTATSTFTFMPTPVQTNSLTLGAPAWGIAISGTQAYVSDFFGNTIRKFNLDGTPVAGWTNPAISHPIALALDGSGNLYAGGYGGGGVQVFNPTATPVATWAPGVGVGGIQYDGSGKIYYGNSNAAAVNITDTAGAPQGSFPLIPSSYVTGLALAGSVLFAGDDNIGGSLTDYNLTGTPLGLSFAPYAAEAKGVDAIVVDGAGRIYVGTGGWGAAPIKRYSPSGVLETQWGNIQCYGMAFDGAGNLYVGDISGKIYVFAP